MPSSSTGFPVMIAGVRALRILEYSSAIHPMIRWFVYTSGAGTSTSGPSTSANSRMYPRLSRCSSALESCLGSTVTPPFPPPNGIWTTAHLHAIQRARAFSSSRLTSGWNRIPPFAGPRVSS